MKEAPVIQKTLASHKSWKRIVAHPELYRYCWRFLVVVVILVVLVVCVAGTPARIPLTTNLSVLFRRYSSNLWLASGMESRSRMRTLAIKSNTQQGPIVVLFSFVQPWQTTTTMATSAYAGKIMNYESMTTAWSATLIMQLNQSKESLVSNR